MIEIFTIIAPVFLIILLGLYLGKTSLFPAGASASLIAFVWYVAIPALLFRALAPSHLPHASELVLVAGYYISLAGVYLLAVLTARYIFRLTLAEQGVFALASCFSNGAFIGIPVIHGAYGEEGVRVLLLLISFHSLSLMPITTLLVETGKSGGKADMWKRTLMNIAQNPILIALAVSLTWSAFSIPVPEWLARVVALPAAAASPVGLFAAGLALSSVSIRGDLWQASAAVLLKITILPVFVFTMTHLVLALPGLWVGVATLMAAMPGGMMAYSFACQQQVGERRAATSVFLSTVGSVITLTIVLLLLKMGEFS